MDGITVVERGESPTPTVLSADGQIHFDSLKHIFNSLPSGIAIFDGDSMVLCNTRLNTIFGTLPNSVTEDDIFGLVEWDILSDQTDLSARCIDNTLGNCIHQVLNHMDSIDWATDISHDLGQFVLIRTQPQKGYAILDVTASCVSFGGGNNLMLTFRDITQAELIKKIEHLKQFNRNLVSAFSHEVRTPLNAIINFVRLLKDFIKPDTEAAQLLGHTEDASQLLFCYISDLVDSFLLKTGNFLLQPERFNLQCLLRNSVKLIAQKAQDKFLELSLYGVESIPGVIYNDATRLKQVVINLLSNAVKYTDRGGKIRVNAFKTPEGENQSVTVEVIDTGIGISTEDQKKLFTEVSEPLHISQSIYPTSQGVGLGLSVSKSITEHIGSPLQVESAPDKGSRFWFTVDLRLGSLADCTEEGSPLDLRIQRYNFPSVKFSRELARSKSIGLVKLSERPKPSGKAVTYQDIEDVTSDVSSDLMSELSSKVCSCPDILVVDDDSFNRIVLGCMLKKLNLTCEFAFNGQEAVDKVTARARDQCCSIYGLIIMDFQMPVLDGPHATKTLQNMIANGEIPFQNIVGHSALTGENQITQFQESGIVDYLQKPAKIEDLKRILSHWGLKPQRHGTGLSTNTSN